VPLDKNQRTQLKNFGAGVRRQRVRRKLTQEALAELVDLHPRTVQKIESGQTNILITTTIRFKKALACSWEALLGR